MKTIFIFIFLIFSHLTFAEDFIIDIGNNEAAVLYQQNFVLLGHATSAWDSNFNTQIGVRKLVEMGQKYNYTTVAIIYPHHLDSGEYSDQYYFTNNEIDYKIASVGGQHEVLFPNIKNIFIVGGNLSRCLCESIRDVAEGFYASASFNAVNMFIVRDGVYDALPMFNSLTMSSTKQYIERFFVPAFDCPVQNWSAQRRVLMPDVRMDVFYDKQLIGTYDLEPSDDIEYAKLNKKINVHFIHSSSIEENMSTSRTVFPR